MNINFDDVKSRAQGRWISIFRALAIDVREDGRHGPCPACSPGDKKSDRFRLDRDSAERGTWFCSQCNPQAGDGISLVQKVMDIDFKEAMAAIAQVVGGCEKNAVPKENRITSEQLRAMFDKAKKITGNDPASKYLESRGLKVFPGNALWYTPECWEVETREKQRAMFGVFQMPDSTAVCIHRTYLSMENDKLDIKSPKKLSPALVGNVSGGAIRLFPLAGKILGIAEGIETAIAAHQDLNIPVWAGVSAQIMEGFVPPDEIDHLVVIADNDRNFAGQKAAYSLANKVVVQYKKTAEVMVPVKPGDDWLDQYVAERIV
ncbi:MAG: toprim domain-containing protein [Desulfobacteraceae bacterium]|nr:toprim domain-containing protein [Desulfobacteraceae bacterium]